MVIHRKSQDLQLRIIIAFFVIVVILPVVSVVQQKHSRVPVHGSVGEEVTAAAPAEVPVHLQGGLHTHALYWNIISVTPYITLPQIDMQLPLSRLLVRHKPPLSFPPFCVLVDKMQAT